MDDASEARTRNMLCNLIESHCPDCDKHTGIALGHQVEKLADIILATLRPLIVAEERARCAKIAETLPIGGGTLSSWIKANESPMDATRRHIAAAIREQADV